MIDQARAETAVRDLLVALGHDPETGDLKGTPTRVAKAWAEMLGGYDTDISKVFKTTTGGDGFDGAGYDQMIVVSGIEFWSVCEHHMLPFGGVADVGYIPGPDGTVCGLSKLPRLVKAFAQRMQLQERMTHQIAEAMNDHLKPAGVGVRLSAEHLCVQCRGVRQHVTMSTQALLGIFKEHPVRSEFWHLADVKR